MIMSFKVATRGPVSRSYLMLNHGSCDGLDESNCGFVANLRLFIIRNGRKIILEK